MAGVFFSQKFRIDSLEKKVGELDVILKRNNLELINYKVDELKISVDNLSNSFNEFLDEYKKSGS